MSEPGHILQFLKVSILMLAFCLTSGTAVAQSKNSRPYFVMDITDGSIIAANKEFDRWYPASLTKIMTAYVTMKALDQKEIAIGSPVRISKRAASMPPSKMGYKIGTKLRIDTALKILIVKSANDVAVALAEAVSGSVEEFVNQMNREAELLGLVATKFANPNGLHSADQYTSARDMAVLSRRILMDYPQYSHWFAIPAVKTSKKTHYSYNLLLERFDGTNGMKTGFVCASGYNMVASARRSGRTLIAVIPGEKSQTDRAVAAAKLLDTAFKDPDQLVGNILTMGNRIGAKPVNMRPILCTAEARKNRYEPGAGAAVIKSAYLSERKKSQNIVLIKTGGIDSEPSKAYVAAFGAIQSKIPVPTRRPDYQKPAQSEKLVSSVIIPQSKIPVPTLRPVP